MIQSILFTDHSLNLPSKHQVATDYSLERNSCRNAIHFPYSNNIILYICIYLYILNSAIHDLPWGVFFSFRTQKYQEKPDGTMVKATTACLAVPRWRLLRKHTVTNLTIAGPRCCFASCPSPYFRTSTCIVVTKFALDCGTIYESPWERDAKLLCQVYECINKVVDPIILWGFWSSSYSTLQNDKVGCSSNWKEVVDW